MSDRPLVQSLLDLSLREHVDFASYVGNGQLVSLLRDQAAGRGEATQLLYLHGPRYAGRTHLLQASCNTAVEAGRRAMYLPLAARDQVERTRLDQLARPLHLCLDDVESLAGDRAWEETILHLLNEVRDAGGTLLLAARVPPADLQLALPDLRSRVAAAVVRRIEPLTDDEKEQAITRRATARGLELHADVLRYIMTRSYRDMGSLLTIIDELDRETITQQRKLTIPFVRRVLEL